MMAELELFLAPIRAGAPTGEYLKLSSSDLTYQNIRKHRSEVDPQVDPSGTGRTADWSAVVRECEEALRTKSKDLQIAAWLAEAWARRDGFVGLRDGLELVRELTQVFWDHVHPGVDQGVIEPAIRVAPLNWLGSSSQMILSVKACLIVKPTPETALSWEQYERAQRVDQQSPNTSRYQEMESAGWFGSEEWRTQLRATPAEALRDAHVAIGACEAALEDLRKVASQRFEAAAAPNLSPLGNLLHEIRQHLEPFVSAASPQPTPKVVYVPSSQRAGVTASGLGVMQKEPAPHAEAALGIQVEVGASYAPASPSGPIRSREQALRMLGEVAEYYRANEPHSPIAALVTRAARWGEMPFEQVLREVVRDEEVLKRAFEMLGIRPESSDPEPS